MRGLPKVAHRYPFMSWLLLIAVAGLVLRVAYALSMRDLANGGDGFRFHFGALALADGDGFVNKFAFLVTGVTVPDTGHPPAWTVLLAAPTKLGLRSWLEHGIIASLVGTATIVMTGLAARAAFGRRTGLIAAALAAVYPFFWLYEREVLSEPLAMLGVATMIWLAYTFMAQPSVGRALGLGVVLGLLVMTKSDQIALAIILVIPVILTRRQISLRRRFTWLAIAGVTTLVIIAPWSIYISTRFDRPVIASGSLGGAMAAGNCAQTYDGELLGYYVVDCVHGRKLAAPGEDPISRDVLVRRRAVSFMRAHQRQIPKVVAARIGRTFGLYRPFQQMTLETERGTSRWVFQIAFFAYWALLPAAIAGAIIAHRHKIPLYPLLVFPALVVAAVVLTIGAVRYRAPAEISLVILAAFAINIAVSRWRRTDSPHTPPDDQDQDQAFLL